MSEQQLMKDQLGTEAVVQISQALSVCLTDFPHQQFTQESLAELENKELKQRVDYLISILANYLPRDFAETADVLLSVKKYWSESRTRAIWGSFTAWPLIDYVAVHGLKEPEISLNLLKELTSLFSAEFAIRPFIEQHFDLSYQTIMEWTADKDEHVRRLASEGIRSRLPWGNRLHLFCRDPLPVLNILERLKDDPSLYVRRSVANNLNDIAKDHPEKVIEICQRWSVDATPERQWLIRHALRGLVKVGYPEVFQLLGYSKQVEVDIMFFKLGESRLVLGNNLTIEANIQSKSENTQKLVIDYKVHRVKANGLTTSKVFKWKNITLLPQQTLILTKKHPFKIITTRKYYAGTHTIELLINGVSYTSAEFELRLL